MIKWFKQNLAMLMLSLSKVENNAIVATIHTNSFLLMNLLKNKSSLSFLLILYMILLSKLVVVLPLW